jgi:hypothetical protein
MWVSLVHDDGDWFGLLVLLEWDICWRLKGLFGLMGLCSFRWRR